MAVLGTSVAVEVDPSVVVVAAPSELRVMAADVLLPDWPVKFASVPDIDTAEDRDGGPGCCVLVLKPYVDRAVSVSDVAGYVSLALLDDDAFLGSKVVPAELAMISELGFPTVCELTETLLSDEVTPSSADVTELLRSSVEYVADVDS